MKLHSTLAKRRPCQPDETHDRSCFQSRCLISLFDGRLLRASADDETRCSAMQQDTCRSHCAPVYSLPRAVSFDRAPGSSRSLDGLVLGRPYGQRSANHAYRSTHGSASSAVSVALAKLHQAAQNPHKLCVLAWRATASDRQGLVQHDSQSTHVQARGPLQDG